MSASKKATAEKKKPMASKGLEEFYPGLKRYCRFLAQSSWDGDDLAQEVASKAFSYYQEDDISAALLNKMAYHQWIDTVRKRKHEVVGVSEDLSKCDDNLRQDTIMDTVTSLIEKLTPKQAVIFVLKEGFCYQANEIAGIIGTTEMAVKSSLHRAKKRLDRNNFLHSVKPFWQEDDQRLLNDLLYQSLLEGDPEILLESIAYIPTVAEPPKLAISKHSFAPLNCMYSAA